MGWDLSKLSPELRRRIVQAERSPGVARPCAKLQKLKNDRAGKADHQPAEAAHHARNHCQIPRAVVLRFFISDRRRRDLDGMTATIMDCLVACGALSDDNRFVVKCLEAQAFDCPPGEERVEVELFNLAAESDISDNRQP